MTDQSVSAEVARVQAPVDLVRANLEVFGRVLPNGISRETFGQWALTAMSKALADPKQAQAWERVLDPGNGAGLTSVMVALKDCAALGLRPGSEYHLVPFGSTVTGITDYHGEIRLITNYEPCSVVARLVHKADKFEFVANTRPPVHTPPDWFTAERGPCIGGYAYVAYPGDRFSMVVPLTETDFLRHRDMAKTKTIWDAWPEPMRLKTLVHAVRDFVPWSAERKW